MVDVGGQRSERKKWLKYFHGIEAVLFIVAMSEYDQYTPEDSKVNRMHESLKVFGQICVNKWLLESALLLFLNKKDVFEEKIVYSSLRQCFPEYKGAEETIAASIYIRQQFRCQERDERKVYYHFTNAKDTKNIKIIFEVMVDTIKNTIISEAGLA